MNSSKEERNNYDIENENSLWIRSINMMVKSNDLAGLCELREGPDDLGDVVLEYLNEAIEKLERLEKTR